MNELNSQPSRWKKQLVASTMLGATLVGVGTSLLATTRIVSAAPVPIKPDDTKMAANSLVFSTDAKYKKALKSVTSTNKALKTLQRKNGTTLLYWEKLNNLKSNDTITFSYGAVGTYKGKEIKADFVLSGFTLKENFWRETNYMDGKINYIQVDPSLPGGFTTSGISNIQTLQIKLRYVENNQPVVLGDDSYISFNSLNGSEAVNARKEKLDHREFASYEHMDQLPYYVTNETGVKEYTNPVTGKGAVVGGVNKPPTDAKFIDQMGSKNFKNGSVSYQVKGQDPKFTIGSTAGAQWVAFSSATLFSVNPDKPQKTGDDGKGKDMNNQEVNVGDTIFYHVKQKVNTLSVDLLEKYKKFQLVDHLPKEVDFVSAKVVGPDGKPFDDKGEVVYDKASHTVTYTANDNTRNKKMGYNGETYDLVVQTKVNNQAIANGNFHNTAQTIVNNNSQETNTITDHVPGDSLPVKKVYDKAGNEKDLAEFKKGEFVKFVVKEDQMPKRAAGQKVVLSDDLEDVLALDSKSIKVEAATTKEGKQTWEDVTTKGKLVTDEKTEKLTWTLDDGSLLAGKAYRITFGGTLKQDADYKADTTPDGTITVPNIAHRMIGNQDTPSNKVVVVIPEIDDQPQKAFLLPDGTESQEVQQHKKGEQVHYAIRNQAPNKASGNTFILEDTVHSAIQIDKQTVKMETTTDNVPETTGKADTPEAPKDANQEAAKTETNEATVSPEKAKWTDISDKGNLTVDEKTGKLSWQLDDGSLIAGKHYRLSFNGTLKADLDPSKLEQKDGYGVVPNTATETVGDKSKNTNEVDVLVPKEKPQPKPIPKVLPPTGATPSLHTVSTSLDAVIHWMTKK